MSEKTLAKKSGILSKVRYWLNAPSRLMTAVYVSMVSWIAAACPTFCTTPTSANMNTLFSKMVDIICTIAFYVGAIIIVGGVFNWILSQKDENADGQSRAIKLIVCGFALVALKVIVAPLITSMGLTA